MKSANDPSEYDWKLIESLSYEELSYLSYLYYYNNFKNSEFKNKLDWLRLTKYQPLPPVVKRINVLLDCRFSLLYEIDQHLLNKYLLFRTENQSLHERLNSKKRYSDSDIHCFLLIGDFLRFLVKNDPNEYREKLNLFNENCALIVKFSPFSKRMIITSGKSSKSKLWKWITGGSVAAGVIIAAFVSLAISCKNGGWCPISAHIQDIPELTIMYNTTEEASEQASEINLSLVFIIISAVALLVMWAYLEFFMLPVTLKTSILKSNRFLKSDKSKGNKSKTKTLKSHKNLKKTSSSKKLKSQILKPKS